MSLFWIFGGTFLGACFCICIPDVRGYIAREALLPLTSNQRLCLPDQTSFSSMLFVATSSFFLFPCLFHTTACRAIFSKSSSYLDILVALFALGLLVSWSPFHHHHKYFLMRLFIWVLLPPRTASLQLSCFVCFFPFVLARYIFSDPEMISCIENLK